MLAIRKSSPNPKTDNEISNFEKSSIKHSVDLTQPGTNFDEFSQIMNNE